MKALAISLVVGAALCGIMSAPASTMPMSNLAVAASDLALGQSVRYRHQHRYRLYNYYSALITAMAGTAMAGTAMDQAHTAMDPGYSRGLYGRW